MGTKKLEKRKSTKMSSYGKNKSFAAVVITIFTLIALRIIANIIMPDLPLK